MAGTLLVKAGRPQDNDAPALRTVAPGETERVAATVRNHTRIVDTFDLRLEGLPDGWWSISPASVWLTPVGSTGVTEREIAVCLHPPEEAEDAHLHWPARLVARSSAYDRDVGSTELTVLIAPPEPGPDTAETAPVRIAVTMLARRRAAVYTAATTLKYAGWLVAALLGAAAWDALGPGAAGEGAAVILPALAGGWLSVRWARRLRAGSRRAAATLVPFAAAALALVPWALASGLGLVVAAFAGSTGLALLLGVTAILAGPRALRRDGVEDSVPRWEMDPATLRAARFRYLPDRRRAHAASLAAAGGVGLALPLFGITLVRLLHGHMRSQRLEDLQAGALTVDELRRLDRRRPILHLRSFAADRIRVAGLASRHPAAGAQLLLEDVVGETLWRYGPVIGASSGTDPAPPLAVARAALPMETWQERVQAWIGGSQAVTLVAGSTPGLMWEVERLAGLGAMRRTLLIIPPPLLLRRRRHREAALADWASLSAALGATGVPIELPAELDMRRARVVIPGARGRRPVIVTSRRAGDFSYGAAIDAALARLIREPRGEPSAGSARPT